MPSYDMKDERKPQTLLPEGSRLVRITEMILGKSKNGNEMFTTTIEDTITYRSMPVFLIAEPKKRWMLKSLLNACDLKAGEDGIYNFEISDVIGKSVIAIIEHEDQEYIDREGNPRKVKKAKVTEFIQAEKDVTVQPTAWEEEGN